MKKIIKDQPPDDGHPHIVYDCSIENIEERRKAALHFKSARAAATFLGCAPTTISQYTNRKAVFTQKKLFSQKHNKHFAIRINVKNSSQ